MPTQYLATQTVAGNPVRCQTWNASIRAGDDLKLALTVFADDQGTPAQVGGARGLLTLRADRGSHGSWAGCEGSDGWDYGLGWATLPGRPAVQAASFAPGPMGRLNFVVPSATTGCMAGRYRLALLLDLPDGEGCQVEGILQVRERWCDVEQFHSPSTFFRLDHSPLDGSDGLAAQLGPSDLTHFQLDGTEGLVDGPATDGVPVDADGFYLLSATFLPPGVAAASLFPPLPANGLPQPLPSRPSPFAPVLGQAALGAFVLGDFIPGP